MKYEAGDVIWYQTFGGDVRHIRVTERHDDVKHGRPGFSGIVVSGTERGTPIWGYDYQIVARRHLTPVPSES